MGSLMWISSDVPEEDQASTAWSERPQEQLPSPAWGARERWSSALHPSPTEEGRIRGCLDNGIKLWNMQTICKLLRLRETKLFLFSFPKPLMVIK